MVSFHTFAVKEEILIQALKVTDLIWKEAPFTIRSDLSRATSDRRWELGQRMAVLRGYGATCQLKFPSLLKVMYNNNMHNLKLPEEVDNLLSEIKRQKEC